MAAAVEIPEKHLEILPRYSACLLCRSRKVKCDGRQPKCGRCRVSNQVCEYKYPVHTSRTRLLQASLCQYSHTPITSYVSRTRSKILRTKSK
ncbi:hypothetical protein RSAG8_06849, partial [Rhizoctonia solani AG-8 WAC10335]